MSGVVVTPLAMRLDHRRLSRYLAEAMRGAQLARLRETRNKYENAQAEYESLERELDDMHVDYVRQMEMYEDVMARILRSGDDGR